tara:strand:- start:37616 stop:38575 length:960 start_codon:yes stop_codon:yes gene_type:complete
METIGNLIPPFDWTSFLFQPWTPPYEQGSLWILVMGFLVAASCGLIGNFIILRRLALVGDAISHTILLGIVLAFLVTRSTGTLPMFVGAVLAGLLTSVIIEFIHKHSRIKPDAAIGITFSTLFAIGVILVACFADQVDLDQECVLYGEIAFIAYEEPLVVAGKALAPLSVVRMGGVFMLILLFISLFYKELQVTAFDAGLARSLGINPTLFHYATMILVSLAIVSGFESVGAILVVAMLIFPGTTAGLLSDRLPVHLLLSVFFALCYALLGLHLATWLNCSIAGAMVVVAGGIFALAWLLSPQKGLIALGMRRFAQAGT